MVKRIIRGLFALSSMALVGLGGHLTLKQQRRVEALSAETTATVLGKQVIRRSVRTSGGTKVYARPIVSFQFQAEGRTFASDRVFPHDFEVGGGMGSVFAKAPLDGFEVDQETKAHYNPNDPDQACLIRRPSVEPYVLVLGAMIALSFVLATWPLRQTQSNEVNRRKALLIAVLWHTMGLASVAHYFYLAGLDYGGEALLLFGLYTVLGLFPVASVLRKSKSVELAGRLQGAALGYLIGTFFGFWLGFAAYLLLVGRFRASATVGLRCMGYGMAIPAGLLLIVGLVVRGNQASGEDEGSQEEGAAHES